LRTTGSAGAESGCLTRATSWPANQNPPAEGNRMQRYPYSCCRFVGSGSRSDRPAPKLRWWQWSGILRFRNVCFRQYHAGSDSQFANAPQGDHQTKVLLVRRGRACRLRVWEITAGKRPAWGGIGGSVVMYSASAGVSPWIRFTRAEKFGRLIRASLSSIWNSSTSSVKSRRSASAAADHTLRQVTDHNPALVHDSPGIDGIPASYSIPEDRIVGELPDLVPDGDDHLGTEPLRERYLHQIHRAHPAQGRVGRNPADQGGGKLRQEAPRAPTGRRASSWPDCRQHEERLRACVPFPAEWPDL